jgi:IS30 family transposase
LQRWGLDLLGPLPPEQGNLKYVVVAVEYFTKCNEAKPLATITSVTVQKFFWLNIVYRFGVPKAITVDNGTQFDAEAFKEFCDQIGTKIHFCISQTSRVKWTCRKSKWHYIDGNNEVNLQLAQRKVAR